MAEHEELSPTEKGLLMGIKEFINNIKGVKDDVTDGMNIVERLETFGDRHGWASVLPFFLCAGALLLTKLMGLDLLGDLVNAMKSIGSEVVESFGRTGKISVNHGLLTSAVQLGSRFLPAISLGMVIGGLPAWSMIGIFRTALEAALNIWIDHDRRKFVSNLPEKDRARVNAHDRLRYVSHDNILDKLYDKPNWNGELRIPDGMEYIGEHAFDCLVAPSTNGKPSRFKMFVKSLLIPDSIKDINPKNIPKGATLVFDNATQKIMCHKSKGKLMDRNIKIKGGFFSDVLDECDGKSSSSEVFEKTDVPPKIQEGIKNAFAKFDDPLIKIYLLDKVHEQILKGNMSPTGFEGILEDIPEEDVDKTRYQGLGVIERIYGSRQNATDKYAYTYYETENILNRQNDRKWAKAHADEAMATYKQLDDLVRFIEDVADNPDRFRRTHMEELNLLALSTVSRPHGFTPPEKTDVAEHVEPLITDTRRVSPDMPQPVQEHKEDFRSVNKVSTAPKHNSRDLR